MIASARQTISGLFAFSGGLKPLLIVAGVAAVVGAFLSYEVTSAFHNSAYWKAQAAIEKERADNQAAVIEQKQIEAASRAATLARDAALAEALSQQDRKNEEATHAAPPTSPHRGLGADAARRLRDIR